MSSLIRSSLHLKLREYEKRVGFDAREHAYFFKGRTLTSMTTLYKKFFPKFDSTSISENLARKELGDVDYSLILHKAKEIRNDWGNKAKLGTIIHNYAELLLLHGSPFEFSGSDFCEHEDYLEHLANTYPLYASEVLTIIHNNPVILSNFLYSELVVWDSEFSVAGQVDFLTWNDDGSVDLWDWKTSGSITPEGVGFGKFGFGELAKLPDTNFYHYSLQLSGYAFMLEKNLGLKVRSLRIVHLKPGESKVITVPYLKDEAYYVMRNNI